MEFDGLSIISSMKTKREKMGGSPYSMCYDDDEY